MNQNLIAKQDFTTNEMQLLQSEMSKRETNSTLAWVLWFFLGTLGGHRFLLGEKTTGAVMLILTLMGWATSWLLIGFLILPVVWIWWVVDAFNLSKMIDKRNESVESEIVQQILHLRQISKNDELASTKQ